MNVFEVEPYGSFRAFYRELARYMHEWAEEVDTGHWQSMENVPLTRTLECRNVTLVYSIPRTETELHDDIRPSAPWAEAQFLERVSGMPWNPGDTFYLWPYYRGNVEKHKEQGTFSHTYAERMWPRCAGLTNDETLKTTGLPVRDVGEPVGIRFRYGDLDDVVNLLVRHPTTRQAYLPIWYPEDTGAHHGERVPCTLGYHFLLRDHDLHVTYPIRSCDFIRHFADDVYLASRLCQWMISQLQASSGWEDVEPGQLVMHMISLHVFAPERNILKLIAEGKR